ncbi:MAG TPA: hypothetical protein VHS99_18150 [Chloroflexota bacterium]|jgi:hypothetical protein|nr:hypothetical protein [Chloroflexota bacterium]
MIDRRRHLNRLRRTATHLIGAVLLCLATATPVAAHGEVSGVQDVVQDYGVLVFLVATVLIGAGVLAWVTFSPQAGDEDETDDPAEPASAPHEPANAPQRLRDSDLQEAG